MEAIEETATPSSGGTHQALLLQGPVELRRGWRKKKRHLFLSNDVLTISNNPRKKHFKIKHVIPLSDLWMADYLDIVEDSHRDAEKSILLFWPMENFVATFRSSEQKDQWRSLLQSCINQAKEKGDRKSITVEIFPENILSCARPLYVTATNLETVNDIIKKLLPMLGRPHAEEDYQLWFCPGPEEASHQLKGQERPYDIKMSHLQKAAFRPRGPRNCSIFPTRLRLSVKHLSPAVQGRFILKLIDTAHYRQKNNKEKPVKKRRSFMNRVFRRESTTCQDPASTATPEPKTGQLFGRSLTDLCEDGNLPTSILEMITIIHDKGPSTEGIFRVPGIITSCRALRQKLDSGEEVNLSDESIHVVASVLKDFLRNIKGTVLTSNLYKWFAIMDEVNEEEKVPSFQSLLQLMPTVNVDLLRHLMGALYSISKHSSVNHMTAYNLSVYTAPSILSLHSVCSMGLGNDISKKIALVQFLLENCLEIFGEDILSLGNKSSMSGDNTEEASGSLNHGTDFDVEKTDKGRCPLRRRTFRRGSSTCQNRLCQDPRAPSTIRLLGRSLVDVCEDGNLPTTVLNMLALMNEQRLDIHQILRVPTITQSYIALRERLDSGEELTLRSEPPLAVASVLMDFLRYVRESLLSTSLYDQRLDVLDNENEEQKISVILSPLQQLMEPNFDLLRLLFGMLLNIKRRSSTPRMTAHSLSVCTAPSLLCLLAPATHTQKMKSSRSERGSTS